MASVFVLVVVAQGAPTGSGEKQTRLMESCSVEATGRQPGPAGCSALGQLHAIVEGQSPSRSQRITQAIAGRDGPL